MHTSLRPFTTAGVALVGASAIAITPVAMAPALPDVKVANPAVQLSAAVDPITPWLEVFNNSEVNLANLASTWLEAPAPVLQQVIANQIGYLGQLPNFPVILEEMVGNLGAALQAPFAEDLSTMTGTRAVLYDIMMNGLLDIIPPGVPPELQPLFKLQTTYLSGVLLGLVGPVINPVLALASSVQSVVGSLTGEVPDLQAALNTLINTPAAMVDSFLNGGQSIDITPLIDALGIEHPLQELNVRLTFGGLLSPAGTIFNALGFNFSDGSSLPGQGPGFVGSLIALTQTIAKAIGWDGTGNPLAPPINTPEEPDTENTPDSALRQANDTSMLASSSITLESSPQAPAKKISTVDETAPSTEETGEEGATGSTDESDESEGSKNSEGSETPSEVPNEDGATGTDTPTEDPGESENESGTPNEDDATSDDPAKDDGVKDSPKAVPGETGTTPGDQGSGSDAGDADTGSADGSTGESTTGTGSGGSGSAGAGSDSSGGDGGSSGSDSSGGDGGSSGDGGGKA